ncbi:MAG: hypothetical protein GX020_06490 [Firmicutes bacterium]|nr:hypothetical protein [Bacillota bacterium]
MVQRIAREILLAFFSALGVILGGSIIGSLAALFTSFSPISMLRDLAKMFRLWAILVAIGGTFPTIRIIESGLFYGQIGALIRQLAIIVSALLGAYVGYWILITLTGGE